ncbi:MAG: MFS transporter [Actinobacteria bacterium]|nr:MFS transporter [Actinomycetota bacterium]
MHKRIATYLCCLIMFIFGMSLVIISTLLSEISKDFHLSMAQSGIFFSINFIGFILFIFIGGILAERYGKKRVISVAMFGLAAALLAFGVSPDKYYAFAAVFFIGGFGGIIESMVSSLVADLNTDHAGYYINLSQVFLCVGAVIGPILGSIAVSSGMGWRVSYYVLAFLSFLLFLVFSQKRVEETAAADKIELSKLKDTISDKKFLIVCLCIAFYAGSEVGAWGWMTTFLRDGMGFSISKSAIIVGAFWISMTVGRIVCGKLTKFFEIEYITIFLAFFSAFVVLLSGLLTGEISMFIVTVAMGLAFSSQYPFLVSIGSKLRANATAFSLLIGCGGLGVIVVPVLMGWIGDYFSIRIAMMSPSLLFLTMGVVLMSRAVTGA